MLDDVRAYYATASERERARLANEQDGTLEFLINRHVIAAHLPPGARVLDIGGGPGRYTLWLAERGHRVVLADLSPELLAIAREQVAASAAKPLVEEIIEADARDLSRWPDAAFDAVLALGPFYHLTAEGDRNRAAAELARVVRPGGPVFVAVMPRYAFIRRVLAHGQERHQLAKPGFLAAILDHGVFRNDRPGGFTAGYGFRPEAIAPFFEGHGFTTLALVASEGIVPDLQGELAALATADPAAYRATLDAVLNTAADPSILGLSNHLLYVGRKASAVTIGGVTLEEVTSG